MRNLKRALSLTLASVMLLGMMVVGSSAAGYPDVSEEENIEAIEVLQSVGVMEGDNNGNFNPDDYVTREQMAVIMSKLLNLDYNYYQGTNPFSDVPAWAAPYVAACAANGITSGIGGGMYGAGQNVNAVQAALMMLKALGYFQYQQDFGDSYVLATVKQATEVGLFNQIDSNAQSALTRNEVAQMALNALKSDLVRFTGDVGTKIPTANGEIVVGYKSEYTPRTSTDPKYNRLIDNKHSSDIDHSGQYYCQLGEELYNGDLVQRYDSDIFERPSYTWTYKTELIGTYVDKAKLLASYTSGVSGRTLYDLLNNITIRDYDLEVYVDGHAAGESDYTQYGYDSTDEDIAVNDLVRSNTDSVGATADGVLTEVYLDRDNEIITIASIHTWLAQGVSAYSETRESATMKVYMTSENGTNKTVSVDDVPEVEGVAADTFYLVRMSDKDTQKLEVVDIDEPEILAESTITKFSNGKKNNIDVAYPDTLTTNGVEYKDSDRAIYDADTLDTYDKDLLANNTYNVYLDKYGYFIGIDLCEGTKQYVFVTGYDMRNSNLSIKTAEAAGIFLDGTMETITVNVKDTNKNIQSMVYGGSTSNWENPKAAGIEGANAKAYYQQWSAHESDGVYLLNRWYTYTENNGVYTLKPCVDKNGVAMMLAAKTAETGSDDDQTMKLNCSKLRLDGVEDSLAPNKWGDLLMGESMTYTKGDVDPTGRVLAGHRAYGEDDSVFITVDVDDVSATAGDGLKVTKAITDVNGVYTGVQDVDIITKTSDRIVGNYYEADGTTPASRDHDDIHWLPAAAPYTSSSYVAENAYAVYDKNNFIIGAVILGEAEGSNATKAYILDPVKYERYENGTYYWQFEAVINGEIVTQEAESKFASTIDTMRNNQYEIVELRYNAAGDVVTEVKAMDRIDTGVTSHLDKIYGYPYGEILTTGHKVADNESVYDVVLTGGDNVTGTAGVHDFKYVTRPRANDEEHDYTNTAGALITNRFTTTAEGTLRLQGRTMYVLDGQHDYGIDFVTGAKAVVRQMEGNVAQNDLDWKNRAYSSVQEAIDSLGDADPTSPDTKQFKGIVTAVLDSRGVAEWIVFYSDTPVDTKTNNVDLTSTMKVKINVRFGATGEAQFWDWYYAPKPTGSMATIPTPDDIEGVSTIKQGWKVVEVGGIPTVWDKKAEGKEVTFTYVETAVGAVDETVEKIKEKNGEQISGGADRTAAKKAVEKLLNGLAGDGVSVKVTVVDYTAPTVGVKGFIQVKATVTKGSTTVEVQDLEFILDALTENDADKAAADAAANKANVEAVKNDNVTSGVTTSIAGRNITVTGAATCATADKDNAQYGFGADSEWKKGNSILIGVGLYAPKVLGTGDDAEKNIIEGLVATVTFGGSTGKKNAYLMERTNEGKDYKGLLTYVPIPVVDGKGTTQTYTVQWYMNATVENMELKSGTPIGDAKTFTIDASGATLEITQ